MMKRERFLLEMTENSLFTYDVNRTYEEQIIGEFENCFEAEYLNDFVSMLVRRELVPDLACGDGRHTLQLSKNTLYVIAFDLSSNSLKIARKKCQNNGNISFIKGSMFELPFQEHTFDGV